MAEEKLKKKVEGNTKVSGEGVVEPKKEDKKPVEKVETKKE